MEEAGAAAVSFAGNEKQAICLRVALMDGFFIRLRFVCGVVLAGVGNLLGLSGFFAFLGFTGWQVLQWLYSGQWHSLGASSVGLRWLFEKYAFGSTLHLWTIEPQGWIGLHRLLDFLSVGAALALVGGLGGLLIVANGHYMIDEAHSMKGEAEREKVKRA